MNATRYHYWATDAQGREVQGNIDAVDLPSASALLKSRGLHVRRLRRLRVEGTLLQRALSHPAIARPLGWITGRSTHATSSGLPSSDPPNSDQLNSPDDSFSYTHDPAILGKPIARTDVPPLTWVDPSSLTYVPTERPNLPSIPSQQINHANTKPLEKPPFDRVEAALAEAGIGFGLTSLRQQVDALLANFPLDDLADHERETWFAHRILAADADGDTDEAVRRAEVALRHDPGSARVRLVLTRLRLDQSISDESWQLLDHYNFEPDHLREATHAVHLAWFYNDLERASRFLRLAAIGVFNRIRAQQPFGTPRVPGVGTVLWSAVALAVLRDDWVELGEWIEFAERIPGLDDPAIRLFIEGRSQNDFTKLLEHNQSRLSFSDGMESLQSAILRSHEDSSHDAASQRIGAFRVPAHREDLNIVKLIALYDIAHQAQEHERSQQLAKQILDRAPLLLPPEMIAYFNLFAPAARLKSHPPD